MALEKNQQDYRSDPGRHILGKPIVYLIGIWGIGYLPKWFSYWFARRIADISYLIYKKARQNVKKNLYKAFPDLSKKDLSILAIETFRNYSIYLVDYGRFKSIKKDLLTDIIPSYEGKENLEWALERGKGLIILTGHIGNWELGGIFFGKQGLKINVVTFVDETNGIDEIREKYRKGHNINTVVLGDSPFAAIELLNALKRNEVVAMLVDRYKDDIGNTIEIEFFGRTLHFPAGPLILAKMTGATILTGFVVKDRKAYHAIIGKPITVKEDDPMEDQAKRIIFEFEDCIRRYPDQWYNFVEI